MLPDRVVEKIDKIICWEWIGATSPKGYGQVRKDGTTKQAHRAVWEWEVGPIPEGLELDHLCGRKNCVNPHHLEAVTHQENVRRRGEAQSHCKRGHPFTGDNLKIRPNGSRFCVTCGKERDARRVQHRGLG